MARIVGVEIPNDKQVAYSLTYIYGIGLPTAKAVCAVAKVDETKRVKDLSEAELNAIRSEISKYKQKVISVEKLTSTSRDFKKLVVSVV